MRAGVIVRGDDDVWSCDASGPVLVPRDPWLRCWIDDDLGIVWVHTRSGYCCVPWDVGGLGGAPSDERREVHAERVVDTAIAGPVVAMVATAVEFVGIGLVVAVLISGRFGA